LPSSLFPLDRMRKIILGIFLLGVISLFLSAQEGEPAYEELYFNRDLELSSLEDLQIWCRSLGLAEQGSLEELKGRLLTYYNFTSSPSSNPEERVENRGMEIIIESADKTEYINWEDRGDEIHLTGGVRLTINDSAQNRSYLLSADRIIFSRMDDSLTAIGHVRYDRKKENGNPEHFEGESMTFHISGWKGVIFKGVSSRKESVNDKEIEFQFSGSQINSSGFDVAVLDKGMITSGKLKDPEYSIRASKIWLLGPEEWGLAHGILYLGRVPLLYLPFYYKPGNDMVFNPALGYYSREGTAIQTTTYLLGQKKPVNTSFFSAGLNSDSLYELERRGLFLYKGEEINSSEEDYLKIMADWYSRLGVFTGIKGKFEEEESKWDFFTGLGFSRSIDVNNNIYFYENGTYDTRWNSTVLGPAELPFRWGSEISFVEGNFSLSLAHYSDPLFMGDFMTRRQESFDALNWLLSDRGDESIFEDNSINSLRWEIGWHESFSPQLTTPWLSNIRINRVKSSLQWDSRLDSDVLIKDPYSPGAYFFYPRQLILPDLGLSLSGKLWESHNNGSDSSNSDTEEQWLIPEQETDSEREEGSPDSSYFMPDLRVSRSIEGSNFFSGALSWNSSFSSLVQNDFDFEDWTGADQISYAINQGKMSLTNSNGLDLKIFLFDNALSLSNSMDYKINRRVYLEMGENSTELTTEQLKDQFSYDSMEWNQFSTAKLNPFKYDPVQGSYIKYNAALLLYDKRFVTLQNRTPVFEERWFGKTRDSFKTSEGEIYLEYTPTVNFKSSFQGVTDLYTDTRETNSSLTSRLEFQVGNLNNQFDHNFQRTGEIWKANPLNYRGTWEFPPVKGSISDQFSYDMTDNRFTRNQASLKLYGLNASLVSSYTDSFKWNMNTYLWEPGSKAFQLSSLHLSYDDSFSLGPFWKNRFQNTIGVKTSWNQDLIRINNSVMDFSLVYHTYLHDFWDLNISVVSQNKNIYLYFPAMRESLGIEKSYNFWEDLAKSFNFFNENDRYESAFNLSSIKIDLIHNLGSWNGILNYTGSSEKVSGEFKWQSQFSFFILWDPIPSINMKIDKDREETWDIKAGDTEN
jgi:hypothetical protein